MDCQRPKLSTASLLDTGERRRSWHLYPATLQACMRLSPMLGCVQLPQLKLHAFTHLAYGPGLATVK